MPNSKTVNVITTSFYPERTANANRINSLVKVISKDCTVNVIYLLGVGKAYASQVTTDEFGRNVNFHPIVQKEYNGANFVARTLHELWFSIKLNQQNLRIKSDVSIFSVPYLMLLPVSGVFNFIHRRRTLLEIRDLIWLYLDYSDKKFFRIASKVLENILLYFACRFDFLITVTRSQLDYFCAREKFAGNVAVISNGIDELKFQRLSSIAQNKKHKITITYAGTIGFPQNLITFVEAAKILKDQSEYHFCIAGRGNDLTRVLDAIKLNELCNIDYLGELDWDELLDLYSESSILYAQLFDRPSFLTAQPSKIFEYASTGLPIIYGGFGEGERLIAELENCKSIQPSDPLKLVRAITDVDTTVNSKFNKDFIKNNYIRESLLCDYLAIIN